MEYRDPATLQPHPTSQDIYGENHLEVRFIDDIREHGIRQPLIVSQDNTIISGHRRWRVAILLELTSVPVEIIPAFADDIEEKRAILANNLQREKVYSQKMKEAEYWKEIEKHDALLRQQTTQFGYNGDVPSATTKGTVADIVGERVGIGKRHTFERAEKVWRGAKEGNPVAQQLVQELDAGSVSIKKAHRILTNKEREIERATQADARLSHPLVSNQRTEVILGNVEDWESLHLESSSVDAVITDPPYGKEHIHLIKPLAALSNFILKPCGSLFVMIGQSYLPTVYEILSSEQGLIYNWTLAYLTPGGQSPQLWDRKVNSFWKPILWFVKGEYKGKWLGDVVKSDVNDNDKDFHKWGQSESGMADLIRRCSEVGDIILDPFMGAGTTGKVALDLERSFIGIDNSVDAVNIAKQRLGLK